LLGYTHQFSYATIGPALPLTQYFQSSFYGCQALIGMNAGWLRLQAAGLAPLLVGI
jgi:hypothetical protein